MSRVSEVAAELIEPLVELLLSIADDKLVLGHRNAEWTGLGPILEEDIAFSSIAQDELAHAQALYEMVATLRHPSETLDTSTRQGQAGATRGAIGATSADRIAYGRTAQEYRCAAIVEVSDDFDWAKALMRQFFCDHFDVYRLDRLAHSNYAPLAALAARLRAEEQIHVEHADGWVQRLAAGGEESRKRIQSALETMVPLVSSLCDPPTGVERLEAAGLYPGDSQAMNRDYVNRCREFLTGCGLECAALSTASLPRDRATLGRSGGHRPEFVELLEEMSEVFRLEPEAAW